MWMRRAARRMAGILVTLVAGGFLGATMVRYAPGFGVDEEELDARLNAASQQALRESPSGERNLFAFYGRYLSGVAHGDLGTSRSLGRPVRELMAERLPVTMRIAGLGLVAGWLAALGLAIAAAFWRPPALEIAATASSGVLAALPSTVAALVLLYTGGPAQLAIAAVLFPRLYRFTRNLLAEAYELPHVLAGMARGLERSTILFRHVLPVAAPQLVALAGVSVCVAFGAAIPVEVLCDEPGIGQLAWQAAMARDLPLLVNLTLLVAGVTLTANAMADLAGERMFANSRTRSEA